MNSVEQTIEEILRAHRASFEACFARAADINAVRQAAQSLRAALAAEVSTYIGQLTQAELIQVQARLTAHGDVWLFAAIEKQMAAFAELARRDAITGIGNRAAFDERLQQELTRARRYGRPLALALLDVDGFKSVNDRLGHPAGDQLLASVAQALQRSLRSSDAVFRYGGDEFAALSPETSSADLTAALRRAEQHRRMGDGVSASITVSCGVASFPPDATNEVELIRIADQRLYAAKREARETIPHGKPHIA